METAKESVARRAVAGAAVRHQARLPPGFRFRPTDLELVVHYLRRRALDSPLPPAVDIPDVRLLAHDPSDLLPPGWSEHERYFFTCKEAKYVKGRRANRATGAGYWKATGKEKPVSVAVPAPRSNAVVVGMKRSLVFYRGKAPSGKKTDWVMHEYRLAGAGLAPCRRAHGTGDANDAAEAARPADGWVLCRVFRKKKGAASTAAATPSPAADDDAPSAGFIDFFAREDAQRRRRRRRASSPVVSSSCVTDASTEHCREPETTCRGASP